MVKVLLKCVFCKNNLTYNPENPYKKGDMIKCTKCGRMNDYNSLMKVAINSNKLVIKKEIEKELRKSLKKLKFKITL